MGDWYGNGSSNLETICKLIADLPIVDLLQVLNDYSSLVSFTERINADISRKQAQLFEDHHAMVKLQRCGEFRGHETFEQRYQRQWLSRSHIPLSPAYLRSGHSKEEVKEAIFLEVFSAYGARAYKIVDELLSLEAEVIIAFSKSWKLLNAHMKRINEQINLQS